MGDDLIRAAQRLRDYIERASRDRDENKDNESSIGGADRDRDPLPLSTLQAKKSSERTEQND